MASDVLTDRIPGQVDKDNCACLPKDKGTTVLSKRQRSHPHGTDLLVPVHLSTATASYVISYEPTKQIL